MGTVQREAGQVATLPAWRQQAELRSPVMDGFTLFRLHSEVGGGGAAPGELREVSGFLLHSVFPSVFQPGYQHGAPAAFAPGNRAVVTYTLVHSPRIYIFMHFKLKASTCS